MGLIYLRKGNILEAIILAIKSPFLQQSLSTHCTFTGVIIVIYIYIYYVNNDIIDANSSDLVCLTQGSALPGNV